MVRLLYSSSRCVKDLINFFWEYSSASISVEIQIPFDLILFDHVINRKLQTLSYCVLEIWVIFLCDFTFIINAIQSNSQTTSSFFSLLDLMCRKGNRTLKRVRPCLDTFITSSFTWCDLAGLRVVVYDKIFERCILHK